MRDLGHLVLADGRVFLGNCIYEKSEMVYGELVFSTAATGYTEIISDPSYFGQILVLSNPEVGNYGVNFHDQQSSGIKVKALVVRNISARASSHRSELTLADWFLREGVPIFFGVDTRALVEHIRTKGAMMAALSVEKNASLEVVHEKVKSLSSMTGQRLSMHVCAKGAEVFNESNIQENYQRQYRVLVFDFGVKREILRYLKQRFAEVIITPPTITAEQFWAHKPDGLFLSNGPGDPQTETEAVSLVRKLLGKVPIFGVCLGHQILAQALGFSTYKMKFGHRGSNHVVKNRDGRIMVSAQNHGFAVKVDQCLSKAFEENNITDQTNEGIARDDLWAFSVQFHPEGAPGPHDAIGYFDRFVEMIDLFKDNQCQPNAEFQPTQAMSPGC